MKTNPHFQRPKRRKPTSLTIRLAVEDRQEIMDAARSVGQTDTGYMILAHKLFVAELRKRGTLPAATLETP